MSRSMLHTHTKTHTQTHTHTLTHTLTHTHTHTHTHTQKRDLVHPGDVYISLKKRSPDDK